MVKNEIRKRQNKSVIAVLLTFSRLSDNVIKVGKASDDRFILSFSFLIFYHWNIILYFDFLPFRQKKIEISPFFKIVRDFTQKA